MHLLRNLGNVKQPGLVKANPYRTGSHSWRPKNQNLRQLEEPKELWLWVSPLELYYEWAQLFPKLLPASLFLSTFAQAPTGTLSSV